MNFNFGIVFAIICLIIGLLMMIFYQPFWWLMKKKKCQNIINGNYAYQVFYS